MSNRIRQPHAGTPTPRLGELYTELKPGLVPQGEMARETTIRSV
jgi:hypothetical protein